MSFIFMLFITSLLTLFFALNDDQLVIYQKASLNHQIYAESYWQLTKQMAPDTVRLQCQQQEGSKDQIVHLFADFRGISQGRYCLRQGLFKQDPKKSLLEQEWDKYIDEAMLNAFSLPVTPIPLLIKQTDKARLYYFNQKQAEIEIQGNVYGILLVKGELLLRGEGTFRGVIITKGKVLHLQHKKRGDRVEDDSLCEKDPITQKPKGKHCLRYIDIRYDKAIAPLKEQYVKWHLMENSWHDFDKQMLSE